MLEKYSILSVPNTFDLTIGLKFKNDNATLAMYKYTTQGRHK